MEITHVLVLARLVIAVKVLYANVGRLIKN